MCTHTNDTTKMENKRIEWNEYDNHIATLGRPFDDDRKFASERNEFTNTIKLK